MRTSATDCRKSVPKRNNYKYESPAYLKAGLFALRKGFKIIKEIFWYLLISYKEILFGVYGYFINVGVTFFTYTLYNVKVAEN